MTEFDPIARAGEAIGKTVEQLLADNDRLTAENARLNSLINDTANHWLALQIAHPIAWEGAIDEAMRAACDEIARLRAKLELTPENVERVKDALPLGAQTIYVDEARVSEAVDYYWSHNPNSEDTRDFVLAIAQTILGGRLVRGKSD